MIYLHGLIWGVLTPAIAALDGSVATALNQAREEAWCGDPGKWDCIDSISMNNEWTESDDCLSSSKSKHDKTVS